MYYTTPGSYYSKRFADGRVYLIDKKGEFPTGLLPMVNKWFVDNSYEFERVNLTKRPQSSETRFKLQMDLTPYPYQENLMARLPGAFRGTIAAITGSGKSIMMAMLINKLQLRTLVIVPNLTLKAQLTEVFTKLFGKLASRDLRVEFFGDKVLTDCKDYDLLIIDEAHHSSCSTIRDLNKSAWQNIYYRYFFTGTPFKALEEDQIILKSIIGDVIHEVTYEDALSANTIVPVEAFYVDVPKVPLDNNDVAWAKVYNKIVVNNRIRNKIIALFVTALKAAKASTIILVKEIEHGQILSDMTGCHFVQGENKDNAQALQMFNLGQTQMIGTVGVLGEGADTRPTEWIIIAGLGKSKPAFMQMVGRGLRKFPGKKSVKVLLFRDPSHKWGMDHFRAQCKTLLEEYGAKPVKLEIEV